MPGHHAPAFVKLLEDVAAPLTIERILAIHRGVTDREYATLTPRARATRSLDFKKLVELEIIERKGRGRSTYYQRG